MSSSTCSWMKRATASRTCRSATGGRGWKASRWRYFRDHDRIRLSPDTPKLATANRWLSSGGAGLDGIIAKRGDLPYLAASRDGMQKIKRHHTADCVVGGFRYAEAKNVWWDRCCWACTTNTVCSIMSASHRASPVTSEKCFMEPLEPLKSAPGFTGNAPGGPSRWSTRRSSEWQPVKPKLVVEVEYDSFTGGRFRHGTRLLAFGRREPPRKCTYEQMQMRKGAGLSLLKSAVP